MKIGVPELLIVLAIVLVVFGPSQIPKLTKMLGNSVKGFKEGIKDEDSKDKNA